MRKFLFFILVAALVASTVVYLSSPKNKTPAPPVETLPIQQKEETEKITFADPKKSAHYESNTPEHGDALADVPTNVVIDFNFDLSEKSSATIKDSAGQDWGLGETQVDKNKLTLRRLVKPDSPDGLYTVSYDACWPDGSCHDGYFEFQINRALSSSFEDLRGKKEVTVKIKDLDFGTKKLRVGRGTKIIWVNQDAADHYVNTDAHPAHTYFPSQNSKLLKPGSSYSLVLNEPGIYPYHCSAHAAQMKAVILVE